MTATEQTQSADDKIKKHLQRNLNKEKQARILLRGVDVILKEQGIEAAVKELMRVRLKCPLNTATRAWLRDYRDMLDAWQSQLMPEVVDEFYAYGFRRARNIARKSMGLTKKGRMIPFYLICERALGEMAHRSRLAISDVEESTNKPPRTLSLEDVSQDQLSRGTKL